MARIHSVKSLHKEPAGRFEITLDAAFEGFIVLVDHKEQKEYIIFPGPKEKWVLAEWTDAEWESNLPLMEGYQDA